MSCEIWMESSLSPAGHNQIVPRLPEVRCVVPSARRVTVERPRTSMAISVQGGVKVGNSPAGCDRRSARSPTQPRLTEDSINSPVGNFPYPWPSTFTALPRRGNTLLWRRERVLNAVEYESRRLRVRRTSQPTNFRLEFGDASLALGQDAGHVNCVDALWDMLRTVGIPGGYRKEHDALRPCLVPHRH